MDGAFAALRKSRRSRSRSITGKSGGKTLAARSTAATDHIAATDCCHTGTKAMAALANKLGRLESALHVRTPYMSGLSAKLLKTNIYLSSCHNVRGVNKVSKSRICLKVDGLMDKQQ